MQRHGQQRNGRLLAGGQQHVHLAFARQLIDLAGQANKIIGHTTHGRHHHHDLVALTPILRYAIGHVLDTVRVLD